MQTKVTFSIALVGLSLIASANTGTKTQTYSAEVDFKKTNWHHVASLPQFDSSLGELKKITLCLDGHVKGTIGFENKTNCPTTVHSKLESKIHLKSQSGFEFISVLPSAKRSIAVSAYDCIDDFGGKSGRTIRDLKDSKSASAVVSGNQLSQFVGKGTVLLPIQAVGRSSVSGAPCLKSYTHTFAAAKVTVKYEYNPVPEPATMAGLAFGMVALFKKRKKS